MNMTVHSKQTEWTVVHSRDMDMDMDMDMNINMDIYKDM